MIDINDMDYNLDIKSSIIREIESGEVINCNLIPFLKYLSESGLSDKPMCLYDKQEAGTFVDISKMFIKDLEIHSMLKEYYENKKINELLPIQKIAIREGLLNNQNLLVVSSTSSGKTLLGELSGFNKILNKKGKMLYLLPLVALATMRFDEYNEIPQNMGIKPILKVGESKFSEEKKEQKYKIDESNLIVATYESIDTLLRREVSLGLIDTIVVDEIQVLATDGRGYILDGMIARLKSLYPLAQFIFLSATISDPKLLSDHYGCKLIEYVGNSVPIERFIILNENESNKFNKIAKLVMDESKNLSSTGFKGQSLVFTNSRQKCETLATNLKVIGINAVAFHSGLSSKEKKIIQDLFKKQDISCIVATEALAAGIDTACSLVIFETITMGIENLSVTAFKQMCGRAGRYGKHDSAYVVIFTNYTYLNNLINLLSGKLEPIRLNLSINNIYTEILAYISMRSSYFALESDYNFLELVYQNFDNKNKSILMNCDIHDIIGFKKLLFNNNFDLKTCLQYLYTNKCIAIVKKDICLNTHQIAVTKFGRAVAESFLTVDECVKIRKQLEKNELPLSIAVLNSNIKLNMVDFVVKTLYPNSSFLSFENFKKSSSYIKKMNSSEMNELTEKYSLISKCKCIKPCTCGIQKEIIGLNISGKSISEIIDILENVWKIKITRNELIRYFDAMYYTFENINNIGNSLDINRYCYKEIKL